MRPLFRMTLLLVALWGCARHVVVDPQRVPELNNRDWTVKAEPAKPPEEQAR